MAEKTKASYINYGKQYNFDQLTTASRPFIYDVVLNCRDRDCIEIDCPLTERSKDIVPVSTYRQHHDLKCPILHLFGSDWLYWGDAVKVTGVSRQFLNYRLMNDEHEIEVLRLSYDSALQLELFLAPDGWLWNPVKRGCKFILIHFDKVVAAHIKPHGARNHISGEQGGNEKEDRETQQRKGPVTGTVKQIGKARTVQTRLDDDENEEGEGYGRGRATRRIRSRGEKEEEEKDDDSQEEYYVEEARRPSKRREERRQKKLAAATMKQDLLPHRSSPGMPENIMTVRGKASNDDKEGLTVKRKEPNVQRARETIPQQQQQYQQKPAVSEGVGSDRRKLQVPRKSMVSTDEEMEHDDGGEALHMSDHEHMYEIDDPSSIL